MKPSYRTSKRYLWGSFWAAWGCLYLVVIGAMIGSTGAEGIATLAIPGLLTLIATMLGVHRHYGSKDFEATAIAETLPPSTSPYNAQDDPKVPEAQR